MKVREFRLAAPERAVSSREALSVSRPTRSRWSQAHGRLRPNAAPEPEPSFQVPLGAKVFTIGSCFARNIEEHIARLGFDVPTLRFQVPASEWRGRANGIINKYTPASIYQELHWCAAIRARDGRVRAEDCAAFRYDCRDGAVIDTNLGGYIPVSPERFLERRRQVYETFCHAFESECVTITLGLIEAWFDTQRGCFIQSAPVVREMLRDGERFRFGVLTFDESLRMVRESIELIQSANPGVRILLTTSPVPLGRTFTGHDVLTANTYSKSLLRTVCGELSERCEGVDYFPSYESVTLTRNWEILQEDLVHVTDGFVGEIVGRLVFAYFPAVAEADLAYQQSYTALQQGDAHEALDLLQPALDRAPHSTIYATHHARVLATLQRDDEAVEVLRRLCARNPRDDLVYRRLSAALGKLGRKEEAIEAARRSVELDPNAPFAHLALANALLRNGNLAEAERAARMAVDLAPLKPRFAWRLAEILWARRQDGGCEDALDIARRAVELDNQSPKSQLALAKYLGSAGLRNEAAEVVRDALSKSPKGKLRHRLRRQLATLESESRQTGSEPAEQVPAPTVQEFGARSSPPRERE